MKKVSFDFDDTLSFEIAQNYAKELIKKRIEIHIVTSRYEDPSRYPFKTNHNDLFEVAKKLNIPNINIHFTNFINKYHFFIENEDFIWHLDDNENEIHYINKNTKVKGIWWLDGNYKYWCDNYLDIKE